MSFVIPIAPFGIGSRLGQRPSVGARGWSPRMAAAMWFTNSQPAVTTIPTGHSASTPSAKGSAGVITTRALGRIPFSKNQLRVSGDTISDKNKCLVIPIQAKNEQPASSTRGIRRASADERRGGGVFAPTRARLVRRKVRPLLSRRISILYIF